MTSLSTDHIIGIVLAFACLAFIALYVLYLLNKKRSRLLREQEEPDWRGDYAYNQINTSRAIIQRAASDGMDVTLARDKLEEAESYAHSGDTRQAAKLARTARDMVRSPTDSSSTMRQKVPVEKRPTLEEDTLKYRDLARKAGEKEPVETPGDGMSGGAAVETPPEELAPIQEFRQKAEKNYLESRFEMQMLTEDVAKAAGKPAEEAQRLLNDSKKAFDWKDYTESLRLALRGRRVLSHPESKGIAVSPATTVESPPDEPSPAAMRSSAPRLEPEVTVESKTGLTTPTSLKCPKCGAKNPAKNRFCRSCGESLNAPKCPRCQVTVEPADTYCGICGSPLSPGG